MTGGRDDATPWVPDDDRLDGWERTDRRSETLFKVSAVEVAGHTAIYEDADLRATVRSLSGGAVDRMWRFFFATRLAFTPALPPGIGTAAVYPTVEAQANTTFADILREKGFTDVSRGPRERIRVDSGDQARLRRYEATLETAVTDIDVAAELAVWASDGEFRLAGGAYPALSLSDTLGFELPGIDIDPDAFRAELRDIVRAVR